MEEMNTEVITSDDTAENDERIAELEADIIRAKAMLRRLSSEDADLFLMEDGEFLSQDDKTKLVVLKEELAKLKAEHKEFARKKGGLSLEEKEKWRINSQRTNQVYIDIKDLRLKNITDAGR